MGSTSKFTAFCLPVLTIFSGIFAISDVPSAIAAPTEEVRFEAMVEAGKEIPIPALSGEGSLIGWRLSFDDPALLEQASSCELGVCGILKVGPLTIPGRFGAMKLFAEAEGIEEPEAELASLKDMTFRNNSEFDYKIQIVSR